MGEVSRKKVESEDSSENRLTRHREARLSDLCSMPNY